MHIYRAVELRAIDKVSASHWKLPGWYRWWVPDAQCYEMLGVYAASILPELTRGTDDLDGHCLVYIGITKETLYSRVVKWHICEKHALGKIKHRTLSTFRQSISSLTAGTWADESSTNAVIDRMKVEVFPIDMAVGTLETKLHLESLENQQIAQHLVPLNIRGNYDLRLTKFHRHLQEIRKQGRTLALRKLAIRN